VRIAPRVAGAVLLALVACPAGVLGWVLALLTGRLPRPLARLLTATHRHYARLNGTVYLLTDEQPPPLRRLRARHPVDLRVPSGATPRDRADVRRRLRAVPGMVVLDVALGALVLPAALLGWLLVLATGRMPAPLHRAIALGTSYHARSGAYGSLLTAVRPRLRERHPRTGRRMPPGSGGA
jgi:hypothetical protein